MIDQNQRSKTYDLRDFTIRDITECGRAMRSIGEGGSSMEEVASRIVRYLYDNLTDGTNYGQACSLVRFFKTHPYENLENELGEFAVKMLGGNAPVPETKCFTLLGTVGENPEWNMRGASRGHQAIPLLSDEVVRQIPMMRNVIKQLGLSVSSVVKPDPALLLDMEQKTYSVFLVPEAVGSPYIPAQENFVVPYGIKSVMGFGGILPSGDLFVIIMFLKVPVARETADLFKNLSLNIKLAILPFETRVFA
jgi:hypothetical protein